MIRIIIFLFLGCQMYFSQNTFREISLRRKEISKYLFNEVLDENTFNSSIVSKILFKNKYITIYHISTFSPHTDINICIFYKRNMELLTIKTEDDISYLLYTLKEKYNIKKSNDFLYIKNKIENILNSNKR